MIIVYLCTLVLLVIGLGYLSTRLFKIVKQKFMTTLQDFQTQIDSMNASLVTLSGLITNLNTEVANLTAQLTDVMPAADAAAALAGVTDVATKLAALVPATPQS